MFYVTNLKMAKTLFFYQFFLQIAYHRTRGTVSVLSVLCTRTQYTLGYHCVYLNDSSYLSAKKKIILTCINKTNV